LDPEVEKRVKQQLGDLAKGSMPDKTGEWLPVALNIAVKRHDRRAGLLYFYDPAGESVEQAGGLLGHHFLETVTGIIFLVDPFSLPGLVRKLGREYQRLSSRVRPSSYPPENAFETLLMHIESQTDSLAQAKMNIPIAVVLTKIDAARLETVVGEEALPVVSGDTSAVETARNRLVRQKLIEWGAERLIEMVEARFTDVSYFTVSAIARQPDGGVGRRVTDPLNWILRRRASHLNQIPVRYAVGGSLKVTSKSYIRIRLYDTIT